MGFWRYIKAGIDMVGLDRKVMKKISADKKATNTGIIILLIAGFLSVVGMYNIQGYYKALIMGPIFTLVFFVLGVGMLQVFVKLFGGQTKYVELFRVLSHAAVMCWLWLLLLIPYVGDILNWAVLIWGIVVSIVAVETINGMSRIRAMLAVIVPFLIALGVVMLVGLMVLRTYGLPA